MLLSAVIAVWAASCGPASNQPCTKGTLLEKAQMCSDRDSLGFAQEFNSGTFIGTRPIETLAVFNGGLEDLSISAIEYLGDSEFKVTTSWDDNLQDGVIPPVKVRQSYVVQPDGGLLIPAANPNDPPFRMAAVITVEFAPTAAKRYTGKLNVTSNAQNFPLKTFDVSGCGVPSDGGASPCYRDGGM